MNEQNNHNDPIERLFREKADEYDITYREEDWLKLEKQLDARDMQRGYRRKLGWLAAASVLILSLIGYYTIQNNNKINQLTEQLNQNEEIQQNQEVPGSGEQVTEQDNIATNQPDRDQQDSQESAMTGLNSDDEQVADQISTQSINNEGIVTADDSRTEQTEEIAGEGVADAAQIIRIRPVEAIGFDFDQNSELATLRPELEAIEIREEYAVDGNETGYFENENGFIAMADEDAESSGKLSPFSSSRFAVGFVISPDLSTAGSVSNFYDPGFKGGIMAEYSLTKNISLISGFAISNLRYKAYGEAYSPPQYWNSGVMPDETTAFCLVLDIPLNLKANVINFDRSRIFATAGISSYIMLNEEYQFSYESNEPGMPSSWSDRTGTRHWLSNAGLSVGIEYDLSTNWTLRAEPHIKVPLKGVGWGDVKLYSMGSFLSLNYRFGR